MLVLIEHLLIKGKKWFWTGTRM